MASARGILAALVGLIVLSSCDETREPNVAGGSSTETSNRLAARYVDEQGSPMRGASVRIRPADWGGGVRTDSILSDGRTRLDTLLDSAGRLNADGFRPGRYAVEVAQGSLSIRGELSTGAESVVDTLLRPGGVSGVFAPAWKGEVRVLGSDVLIPTDDSGRFLRDGLGVGVVVLDMVGDSGGVVRRARVRTIVPPRAIADLGEVQLLTMREERSEWWSRRMRLVVDNTKTGMTRDVEDFPLWIPMGDSVAGRTDASDLRILDEEDTARPYEFVPPLGTGEGGAWARLKRIDGSSSEHHVDILWGNDAAPSWSKSSEVFDTTSGWCGVWHLDRDGACAVQRCSDLAGQATRDSGVVGLSRRFDGLQSLVAADSGTLEPADLGISFWVHIEDIVGSEARLVWKDSNGKSSLPSWGILVRRKGDAWSIGFRTRGGPSDSGVFAPVAKGRWVHVAAVIDRHRGTGAKAELFIDGVSVGVFNVDSAAPASSLGNLILGKGLIGRMDELRVSRVARPQAWFALERVNILLSKTLLHP